MSDDCAKWHAISSITLNLSSILVSNTFRHYAPSRQGPQGIYELMRRPVQSKPILLLESIPCFVQRAEHGTADHDLVRRRCRGKLLKNNS